MKRVLSFVLALSLVVGLMTGITLTASAEDEMPPTVESFSVTAAAPVVGGTPATAADITLSTQNATITNVEWDEYVYADAFCIPVTATFEAGKVYQLTLTLTAAEGYVFVSENLEATTVSSGRLGWTWGNWDSTATVGIVYLPDGTQLIDSVSVTGVPELKEGVSTDVSAIDEPANVNYFVTGSYLYGIDSDHNSLDPIGDTLVKGNCYYLNISIAPKEGYWFAEDVTGPDGTNYSSVNSWGSSYHIEYVCDMLPEIWEANLTGLAKAEYGKTLSASDIKAPENAKYTVEAEFKPLSGEAAASVTFDYGYYDLNITLTPKEGYTFEMDSGSVYINELGLWELYEEYGWSVGSRESSEDEIYINLYTNIAPPNGYIESFRLKGDVEDIEPGQTITAPTVTYYPYADEGMEDAVTVTKTEWVDAEHKAVTGKFEDGEMYYLAVTAKAAEGYGFHSDMWYINLVNSNGRYINETRDYDYSFDTVTVYFPYSLLPTVDEVALTITEPAVGAAPSAVTVPNDAKYALNEDVGYNWYDYGGGEEFEKFETNGKYVLYLSLVPADGYEWAEDLTVTINGEEVDSWWTESDGSLWLDHTYSFKTKLDRVDITMPVPAEGGTANIADIKVPADAAYAIDAETSEWELDYDTFSGTFEKGGNYRLRLYVNVKDSTTTEFSEDCVVYLNGTAYDKDEYDIGWNGNTVTVYYALDLREVISKVELPAVPGEVKAGDAVPEGGELTVPEGANYAGVSQWVIFSTDSGTTEPGETFETGKAYYLVYQIGTKEGYRFAEDLVITAGGKELTGVIKMIGDDEGAIAIMYPVGMKVIDKIELTVTEPVAGQKPGSVTVPQDAPYSITYTGWTTSSKDDISDTDEMGKKEVFKIGNYYWVGVELKAAEGYVFASDVQILVNGEAVDMAALVKEIGNGYYAMGDMAMAAGVFGQLTEPTDNPKTGDNAPIALVAALGVLAAAGMAVVGLKKKEF